MKILDLQVDRFGAWRQLKLSDLSGQLTVFFGPNEAGKTTLLQFVRGVLFGFAAADRRRYLPAGVAAAGGTLHVAGSDGQYLVTRTCQGDADEFLRITGPDGTLQPPHWLGTLLADVDEAIYQNVFALGLTELQELGTLGESQAADWLYRLAGGLDRVSLIDVMRELETSRDRILASDGRPAQLTQLLAQQHRLRGEITQLQEVGSHWERLGEERRQLDDQLAALEDQSRRCQHAARVVRAAVAVQDAWRQRAQFDKQLAALPPGADLPNEVVRDLARLGARLSKYRKQGKQLQARRKTLVDELRQLTPRESLWRNGPRIEALGEQQSWIVALEEQTRELEGQVAKLNAQWESHRARLGLLGDAASGELREIPPGAVARLRPHARSLRTARQHLHAAEDELRRAEESQATADAELSRGIVASGEKDLPTALERAGNRVAQLRRRVELDERLDQLQRHRGDLQQQGIESMERQILPVWLIAGLGGAFVLGVVLIFAQFILPGSIVGGLGWSMSVLGLCGSGGAALAKWMMERSAAHRLDTAHKQLELVERQFEEARDERKKLDQELPRGGGPLTARLQTAERELADLESLLPSEARRQSAEQDAGAARQRADACHRELQAARGQWRDALTAAGLPPDLSPSQARQLAGHSGQIRELARALAQRSAELDQRKRELTAIATRVEEFMHDAGLETGSRPLVEQVRELVAELRRHEVAHDRSDVLKRQARKIRHRQRGIARVVKRLRRRRRKLLERAGVTSSAAYQQIAKRYAELRSLRRERDRLTAEISIALADGVTEAELDQCLSGKVELAPELASKQLNEHKAELERREVENRTELMRVSQQRGQLIEQQRALVADRRLSERQLELGAVCEQIDELLRAWQVRTVTGLMLKTLREQFEMHRQPETLVEASGYLERMTDGRYPRVWTPLGEDVLYVDDADGQAWSVDRLSRGTREQLFLSLRLALAALYARRGVELPLVLDDVLVNFDTQRAKAAAAVLRDFAKSGHQLLVFTCHEHIWKMFKAMKADARMLPDRTEQPDSAEEPARRARPIAASALAAARGAATLIEDDVDDWDEADDSEAEDQLDSGEADDQGAAPIEELDEQDEQPPESETSAEEPDDAPHATARGARGWEVELADELAQWNGQSEAA